MSECWVVLTAVATAAIVVVLVVLVTATSARHAIAALRSDLASDAVGVHDRISTAMGAIDQALRSNATTADVEAARRSLAEAIAAIPPPPAKRAAKRAPTKAPPEAD